MDARKRILGLLTLVTGAVLWGPPGHTAPVDAVDVKGRPVTFWRGEPPTICPMDGCPEVDEKPVICLMDETFKGGGSGIDCERRPARFRFVQHGLEDGWMARHNDLLRP